MDFHIFSPITDVVIVLWNLFLLYVNINKQLSGYKLLTVLHYETLKHKSGKQSKNMTNTREYYASAGVK